MKSFHRYVFRAREGDHAFCYTCGKPFVKGDMVVKTRTNCYHRRHAACYVDAHGEVLL